jgi:hypothetical protein
MSGWGPGLLAGDYNNGDEEGHGGLTHRDTLDLRTASVS